MPAEASETRRCGTVHGDPCTVRGAKRRGRRSEDSPVTFVTAVTASSAAGAARARRRPARRPCSAGRCRMRATRRRQGSRFAWCSRSSSTVSPVHRFREQVQRICGVAREDDRIVATRIEYPRHRLPRMIVGGGRELRAPSGTAVHGCQIEAAPTRVQPRSTALVPSPRSRGTRTSVAAEHERNARLGDDLEERPACAHAARRRRERPTPAETRPPSASVASPTMPRCSQRRRVDTGRGERRVGCDTDRGRRHHHTVVEHHDRVASRGNRRRDLRGEGEAPAPFVPTDPSSCGVEWISTANPFVDSAKPVPVTVIVPPCCRLPVTWTVPFTVDGSVWAPPAPRGLRPSPYWRQRMRPSRRPRSSRPPWPSDRPPRHRR